jgi:Transposase IS200 like
MPRMLRVEYPGAMYHVMSRGDRCENIYLDDVDRQDFCKTLAEACQESGWQVHAYCLMHNHYHGKGSNLRFAPRGGWCLGGVGTFGVVACVQDGHAGRVAG